MTRRSCARSLGPVLVLALLAGLFARPAAVRADGPTPEEKRSRYAALEREVMAAFGAKDYGKAAAACREQIALLPDEDGAHYNLACALARQGRTADALASLAKAVDLGYGDADHMGEDEDLESLRHEKAFADLLAKARDVGAKALAKLYEPGGEVKGVKTVEGDPAGGLRWRLRLSPDATPAKPHRLVVWLHPSGGSMNARVEPMATAFAARGWALLVPTQKHWESWSEDEAKRLVDVTLADAGKVPGVDATRPVLMGFSAGGQMALVLWQKDPARWGGLVLDAAYPIDTAAYQQGQVKPVDLPAGDAVTKTPLFVVVGDADGGHVLWKQVEAPWRAAGVPLRVTYVPGGRHAWLFGAPETAALEGWLADVRAGRAPASEPAGPAEKPAGKPAK